MKLDVLRLPNAKKKPHNSSKKVILVTEISFFVTIIIIPLYLHKNSPFSSLFAEDNSTNFGLEHRCNMFNGTWVQYYSNGPYYTNETECLIDDRQNCMKFGRPDTEFLKWRWKPDDCELPIFDATQFLEIVRGKSMAFVGDSLSRNQMQSLVCLLAAVARPVDASYVQDTRFRQWLYVEYNFTLALLWTTHLVRSSDDADSFSSKIVNLHLDQVDLAWAAHIQDYDYLIISVGQWFSIPLIYYQNGQVVGCHKCNRNNNITTTEISQFYGFKMAHRMAFRTILSLPNYKGIVFLRTISPAHFENGEWNTGGYCARTRPFTKQQREKKLEEGYISIREFHSTQMEEFWEAEREGRERGLKFVLLDTTEAMVMRPDGHPNYYGQSRRGNVLVADCVHWCLPGPIDTWNELLLQMLKREEGAAESIK